MSKKILVVDDEPNVRLNFRMALETEGYEVIEANCGPKALDALASQAFDLAILDIRMPEMDGVELLAEMRNRGYMTPAVIITAYGDVPHAVRAMKLGAIDFLQKPITPAALREVVAEMLIRRTVPAAASGLAPVKPNAPIPLPLPLLLAKHAINCQEFEQARMCLKEALKQNDRPHEAHNLLGVICEMRGDYDEARRCFQKSLAVNSNYEPARQNLERVCGLQGSSTEGTKHT